MRIGIDLGGTKVEGIVLDNEQILHRKRLITPRGNPHEILLTIHSLITQLEAEVAQQCSIGICGPGSINAHGLLRNSNTTELNGIDFLGELEALCKRQIRFSNDANCFALAEAVTGAGRSYNTVFGAILGTGCGGGLIVDRKIITGVNGVGGEWGHNSLAWINQNELLQERKCFCGKRNCNEMFISGSGLSLSYQLMGGEKSSGKDVISKSEAGEDLAVECVNQYVDQLARALSAIINVFDPECIVLGGGLSNYSRLYELVQTIWDKYIFSDVINTRLLPPQGGDSAGAIGAAWLWA
jgi:fructokinase